MIHTISFAHGSLGGSVKLAGRVLALWLGLFWAGNWEVSAITRYVDVNSPAPSAPYTNWSSAARTIQDAVDAAVKGDEILVTNGVYATGRRAVAETTNRVVVLTSMSIRSVNGPEVTVIEGEQDVRCVYLMGEILLSGFTITKGSLQGHHATGGGISCPGIAALVTNCVITGNSVSPGPRGAGLDGAAGGVYMGRVVGCTLSRNSAYQGGAAYASVLTDCIIEGNTAQEGGGLYYARATSCTLTGNSATNGGGAYNTSLTKCLLVGNAADFGGGSAVGTSPRVLDNCIVRSNYARIAGGGTYQNELNSSLVHGNVSDGDGGGSARSVLKNCTVYGNRAENGAGGGVTNCVVQDSIVYYNSAAVGENHAGGSMEYTCTTPLPEAGDGNIVRPPMFVDAAGGDLRLQSNSPCINSGLNVIATKVPSLDGGPRIAGGLVDMGAYEFPEPGSHLPYAWLMDCSLATDGSADAADADGDGASTAQEWLAGTVPTDSSSVLRFVRPAVEPGGVVLKWQSVTNRTYYVERAIPFESSTFQPVISNIPGSVAFTTWTDTNQSGNLAGLYRVGVQ